MIVTQEWTFDVGDILWGLGYRGCVPQDFWGAIFAALHFPPNLQWAVEEMALGDLLFTNEYFISVNIP